MHILKKFEILINLMIPMKKDNSKLLDAAKLEEDLKRSKGDAIHTLTKVGLNLIPVAGGSAAELFNEAIAPPISKRRDRWLIIISNAINELDARIENFKIENLSKNEIFITTFMHATSIAIRNHQEEKLDALKNAVMNSAINIDIEEDLQIMFLDFIDSFTITHLKLLKFFSEPKSEEFIEELDKEIGREGADEDHDGYFVGYRLDNALEYKFTELKGQSLFYHRVLNDLNSKDLLNYSGQGLKIYPDTKLIPPIAELGKFFLAYITSP